MADDGSLQKYGIDLSEYEEALADYEEALADYGEALADYGEALADYGVNLSGCSRQEKRTLTAQEAFLAAFAEAGSIRKAEPAAKVSRPTVWRWTKEDVFHFKALFEAAEHSFRELLQDLAVEQVKSMEMKNPLMHISLLNAAWPGDKRAPCLYTAVQHCCNTCCTISPPNAALQSLLR